MMSPGIGARIFFSERLDTPGLSDFDLEINIGPFSILLTVAGSFRLNTVPDSLGPWIFTFLCRHNVIQGEKPS